MFCEFLNIWVLGGLNVIKNVINCLINLYYFCVKVRDKFGVNN